MAKKRILIVDDEESVARFLRLSLIELAPEYDIDTARSAREALAMMSRQPADMLITDLRMPGIDGLELMRRARERYPRMRMILITGYGDDRIEAQSYQIGACRYLSKPFRVEDLLTAIRQALTPARGPGRDILILPDTQFDAIAERLSSLVFELDAQCALLADVSGRVVAQVGEIGSLDPSMLVSLIGGSFATSFELARYLRDTDAVTLNYHEGLHYDIYSSNVSTDFFVVILFDKQSQASRLGMVWLYVRRALGELQKLIKRAGEAQGDPLANGKVLDSDFGSLLSDSMDQAFGGARHAPGGHPLSAGSTRPEPARPAPRPAAPPAPGILGSAPGILGSAPGILGSASEERAGSTAEPHRRGPEKKDEPPGTAAGPPPEGYSGPPEGYSGPPEAGPPEIATFDLEQAIALGLLDPSWGQDAEDDSGQS